MKESLKTIKQNLISEGIYKSEAEMEWLTDEYIAEQEKKAVERVPFEMENKNEGVVLNFIDYGNHFYKTNNGKKWHWESGKNVTGGNLNCGRVDSWVYKVRQGDTVQQAGRCSAGYVYYKFDIYH